MYFARRLKTILKLWSNRLKPLEMIPMTTLPLLFKPSNCYENIILLEVFTVYSMTIIMLAYDFKPIK